MHPLLTTMHPPSCASHLPCSFAFSLPPPFLSPRHSWSTVVACICTLPSSSSLFKLHLYQAPLLFYGLWQLVKPFADPMTKAKVSALPVQGGRKSGV